MGDEEDIVVRLIRNESKAAIKELAEVLATLTEAPSLSEEKAAEVDRYIEAFYHNLRV